MFSFMGVPEEHWPQLKQWCGSRASLAWGRPTPDEACTALSKWSSTVG